MRFGNEITLVLVLLLGSLLMLVSIVYADQFPQAAGAESVGFDALAYQLFGQLAVTGVK